MPEINAKHATANRKRMPSSSVDGGANFLSILF